MFKDSTRHLTLAVFLFVVLLGGCSSKPKVRLPATSLPASTLESYSIEDLLIYHEGLRLKPYTDTANKLTIGVGRNLDDVGITKEEAMLLLNHDLNRVTNQLDSKIPWWRELSHVRQNVLISMAFNLGVSGLMQFRSMLSALQDGDYAAAAQEMLASRWASQVGNRAMELAYLMENG